MRPDRPVPTIAIPEIQGSGTESPLAHERVRVEGIVTGWSRKGFFIQASDTPEGLASAGLFVYQRRGRPRRWHRVTVVGKVLDYRSDATDRCTTQLVAERWDEAPHPTAPLEPHWLRARELPASGPELTEYLNRLEGMLVGIKAGATFLAPSNPFGDYVVLPEDSEEELTPHGGLRIDPLEPLRWFPGFRLLDYDRAPVVHVGARLLSDVTGPLNYRSQAFQIAASGPIAVRNPSIGRPVTTLRSGSRRVTVMTLNGFNLDPQVEDPRYVADPGLDIDDDLGDGRFRALAQAVVEQAQSPDLIALQEIQDDDGAEQTHRVRARRTFRELQRAIGRAGGPRYVEIDRPPEVGADGGQPGGNIRNGFLYDPMRVEPLPGSVRRLGEDAACFEGSRKVLQAGFRHRESGAELWVLNVHFASKRHQLGLFAPENAGHDPRQEVRVEQARFVAARLEQLAAEGHRYYVTGDFNDFEFSQALGVLEGSRNYNLARGVPRSERYDYNHRGRLQVLMHGIVARAESEAGTARYEILHGNELIGIQPGELGEKPTDHGYVIAAFDL